MTWWKWGLGLLIIAGAGYWWLGRGEAKPVEYETEPVDRKEIVSLVHSSGRLDAAGTVQIGSEVSGTVSEMFAGANSRVKKGELLCRLNTDILLARLRQEEANLKSAEANLERDRTARENAELKWNRAQELYERSVISKQDLEAAEVEYKSAVAQVRVAESSVLQAEAAVEMARTNLDHAEIRSPIDGVVLTREVDVGQTVQASFQAVTLFTIARDLDVMQVTASVAEADIGKIREGASVAFTVDAYPEEEFSGRVETIFLQPVEEQGVVTYTVAISTQNRDGKLLPGMTANLEIEADRRENALTVPNAALRFVPESVEAQRFRGKRSEGRVWIPGGPEPTEKIISIGITDGMVTEVTDGMNGGEKVITGIRLADEEPGESGSMLNFRRRRGR